MLSTCDVAAPQAVKDQSAVDGGCKRDSVCGAGSMQGTQSAAQAALCGCSSQFVQQFESLLPVLLGAASGTFASRLLLGMANSCFGRAKLMGSSGNTLVTAISAAGTQSISA